MRSIVKYMEENFLKDAGEFLSGEAAQKVAKKVGSVVGSRALGVGGVAKEMTDWQMKQMRAQAKQPRSS